MNKFKMTFLVLTYFQLCSLSFAALPKDDSSFYDQKIENKIEAGTVIALNKSLSIHGKLIPIGSELIVDNSGNLSLVNVGKPNSEVQEIVDTGINLNELYSTEYTILNQNESTGEIDPYNLLNDLDYAGPTVSRTKRNGVTNCYHVVKALVKDRIELYGVAAYMAAPQLRKAAWHRYANYDEAPTGSICVFNKGGLVTTSGGHIYGHIGVKGASGIANPLSGFHLKRPFLGCWNEN